MACMLDQLKRNDALPKCPPCLVVEPKFHRCMDMAARNGSEQKEKEVVRSDYSCSLTK